MKIEIFDVGHGGCSVIHCPDGRKVMIDCGYNLEKSWFPSITFLGQRIDLLYFNNLDEDHVEDLPDLCRNVSIGAIYSNPTVDASALDAMKRQNGKGRGVTFARKILADFGPGYIGRRINDSVVDA